MQKFMPWVLALSALTGARWAGAAAPDCEPSSSPKVLLSKAGTLESLAFDRTGRLLFTDLGKGTLNVLPTPADPPAIVATGIKGPGGIALGEGPEVFVGAGNDLSGLFPKQGKAAVLKVNLQSGVVTPYAQGLSGANGLARAQDGTLYASDALASYLGRVSPDGTVTPQWVKQAGNGLALSPDDKVLYVNQSLLQTKIVAVDVGTRDIRVFAKAPSGQSLAFLDGMTRLPNGSLAVAAYVAGQIWRVDASGQICVLARGLSLPSAVAVGQAGQGFSPTSLYVTTHSGGLLELPGVLTPR